MLPVVRGERETREQILLYSCGMVAVTAVPFVWGTLGLAYLVAALALGAAFIWLAVQLARQTTPRQASLLFHSRSSTSRWCSSPPPSTRPSDAPSWIPGTERKNLLWGWGLFVLFGLIAAGTFAIAFIYLRSTRRPPGRAAGPRSTAPPVDTKAHSWRSSSLRDWVRNATRPDTARPADSAGALRRRSSEWRT